ncbi:MAG: HAMP domain-containing histidine kinase [Lachnospiraceae bacterium]|nr:HAMP domain-containing histidine kinase [Lachnospiraceae bacterium]
MAIVCMILTALVLLAAGTLYWRTRRLLGRLDHMLESAMDGHFSESEYTEDMLSRLEARMYQYLSMDRQDRKETAKERDAVKSLVSDISHQTKTPVANILLYSQLLQENESLDERARQIAGQIEMQTEKLNFLIQSLIRTSRLENGIVAVVPKEDRILELIHDLPHPASAQAKGVEYHIVEEMPDICACFDRKWTVEALSNLVDNAVKYTPPGGKVTVSVQEYEMFVRIDVADTGIGISEEETAKIFARFYRSPHVQEERGVGLGLYLAREILHREGGYIKVASVPGEGSVFSVFLSKRA